MLRFDNTYSWTRTKELFYTVMVLPPDTELCERQEEVQDEEEFVDCTDVSDTEGVTVAVNTMSLEPPPPDDKN